MAASTSNILVERLESIRHDVELIIADVRRADSQPVFSEERKQELEYATHGMDIVLRDFSELRDASKQALKNYTEHCWDTLRSQ